MHLLSNLERARGRWSRRRRIGMERRRYSAICRGCDVVASASYVPAYCRGRIPGWCGREHANFSETRTYSVPFGFQILSERIRGSEHFATVLWVSWEVVRRGAGVEKRGFQDAGDNYRRISKTLGKIVRLLLLTCHTSSSLLPWRFVRPIFT